MVLSYPLMAAIQEISARIGRVTGVGIAAKPPQELPQASSLRRAVCGVDSQRFQPWSRYRRDGSGDAVSVAGSVRTRGIGTRHQGRRQGTTAIRTDTASPKLACSTCSSAAGSWLGTIEVRKGN